MDKLRLGIVGLGNMGSGHFYNVFGRKVGRKVRNYV